MWKCSTLIIYSFIAIIPSGYAASCILGTLFSHESECSKFYQCTHHGPVELSCGRGTVFNPVKGVCDHDRPGVCKLQPNKPKPVKCIVGSFFAHQSDCAKYYICTHAGPVELTCGSGTIFNPKIGVCDHDRPGVCQIKPNLPEEEDENTQLDLETERPQETKEPATEQSELEPESTATEQPSKSENDAQEQTEQSNETSTEWELVSSEQPSESDNENETNQPEEVYTEQPNELLEETEEPPTEQSEFEPEIEQPSKSENDAQEQTEQSNETITEWESESDNGNKTNQPEEVYTEQPNEVSEIPVLSENNNENSKDIVDETIESTDDDSQKDKKQDNNNNKPQKKSEEESDEDLENNSNEEKPKPVIVVPDNFDHICKKYSSQRGYLQHPRNCRKFISCINGTAHVLDCPPGQGYNKKSKNCSYVNVCRK